MDSSEAMNRLLSNSCPATNEDSEGFFEYVIELHCLEVKITAKPVGEVVVDDDWQYAIYEIRSMEYI